SVAPPSGVTSLKVHLETGLGERFPQTRVITVPDHLFALLVDEDGLVRDAGSASSLAAIARHPDDFAHEAASSEHFVECYLDVVNGTMVELKPEAAVCSQCVA